MSVKWWAGVLLLMGLLWLGLPEGATETGGGEEAGSSRRMLDAKWRALPEGEMSIAEMEQYAGGLSDEELWLELEAGFENWWAGNGGRERFGQPRLAIFLARELGKRERELGLYEVSERLDEWNHERPLREGTRGLEMAFQFIEMRIRLACFAGWISVDAEEAISRLIESRRSEDDAWPVVNQGFLMYFKLPEFFAMEEVLRNGFRQLARSDFARARALFEAGTGVWAFDPNEVVGSLLAEIPREDWPGFFDKVTEEVGRKFGGKDEAGEFDSFATLLREDDWTGDYLEILIQEEQEDGRRNETLWAIARDRPAEVVSALGDDRIGEETKKWLFVGLVAADPKHKHLLSKLADEQKPLAVDALLQIWELDFRLLTGREGAGLEDLVGLGSVIEKTPMGEEIRKEIEELLREAGR